MQSSENEKGSGKEMEAVYRYYIGDDTIDFLISLGVDVNRPLIDPRMLAYRSAGDPDRELSDLVHQLAVQQGVEIPLFYRDLIGKQAMRMRSLRPILVKPSSRRREAREIAGIMQLKETVIGILQEYIAMRAIDESTGALKPEEFTRQMSGWVQEIMTKRELPGMVATGRLGTGVYPEDDAVLTLARIQSPEMIRRFTALAAPSQMTQVEFLQAAELHPPFKAVVPFLHQEGDPNGFVFATQGYDLMGVDHAYHQIMAEIEIDPILGTRPAVTAVHVPWADTVRTAMYVSRGEPFWAPQEMPSRLLHMWMRILIWTFEFYSAPELVDFLRRVYQHDPDVFARVARQMDLGMIRPADIVKILGSQSPEQTLTDTEAHELDEFSRYVFHLHHATVRRAPAEIIDHVGRTATATSRRQFEELACIDQSAMAVYLGLPQEDPSEVFDFFTDQQKRMIIHSVDVCDAMVEAMTGIEAEIEVRAAESDQIDFTLVPLPEPPPALSAGSPDPYPEGEAFRDDAPPNSDEEIAMMSMPSSFDRSSSSGGSDPSSDPSGGTEANPESDEFRPLTTSDLPSEQTVDASDPCAKPPSQPRFKGKVPAVPRKASMQAIEDGTWVDSDPESQQQLEGDTTEERPSRLDGDEDSEDSSMNTSQIEAPPVHLDTVDEPIDTPSSTRDISGLSHPEVQVPVTVSPTPVPIEEASELESIHGPESEFGIRPEGEPYSGRRASHDSSDAEGDDSSEPDAGVADVEASFHDPDGSIELDGEPDTCEQSIVDADAGDSEDMAAATTENVPAYGQDVTEIPAYGASEESSSLGTNPSEDSRSEESSSKRSRNSRDDEPSSNSGPAKT